MAMLRTLLLLACIVACCAAYYYNRFGYGGDDDYYPGGYRSPFYRSFYPRRHLYYGHGLYYDKK